MSTTDKPKKSKLEKIYELQATNKGLKEENRNLRRELQAVKSGGGGSNQHDDHSISSSNNEEKLMEAMKALKRVTVKQEMSLNTIRSKAEQRRKELAQRDETIRNLKQEIEILKQAQTARKEADANNDLGILREQVGELQLRLAESEGKNHSLTIQFEASEEKAKNLEKQLESARGLMNRQPSGRSMKSSDTSNSEFDIARLKKDLASKIERIVLLEFDLEMCMDEIHELKEKLRSGNQDGASHAVEAPTAYQDEFFSDDEEDEEW